MDNAQKIFGFFDKSQLIDIFDLIFQAEEKKVIETYRKIYDQGIDPKVFLNDFLELIYYFKNINSLTLESTNFSLNDQEYLKIKDISKKIDYNVLILFWQFTIRTLDELDVVANQNLSIEMFLLRLIYLISNKSNKEENENSKGNDLTKVSEKKNIISDLNHEAVSQIKNVTQEKKINPEIHTKIKNDQKLSIDSFEKLLEISSQKKEIKLKYELEKNVNLVSFDKNRIEISFNDNLDKNFVKDLSLKLFEWTNERWIITFSKAKGEISFNEKEQIKKNNFVTKAKETELYKDMIKKFPDANLINIIKKDDQKK